MPFVILISYACDEFVINESTAMEEIRKQLQNLGQAARWVQFIYENDSKEIILQQTYKLNEAIEM